MTGPISATPEAGRFQLVGVRTAVVERRLMRQVLELPGFVAPDEARLWLVQLALPGWVKDLHVSQVGRPVAAGDPLATLTSPQLLHAELAYLNQLDAEGPVNPEGHSPVRSHEALERLRLLGVPETELRRLRLDRVAQAECTARAPASGVVLGCEVRVGEFAEVGETLLTIADLTTVWVLADASAVDFARVRVGDPATFTAEALPGRQLRGRIEFVYPTVSPETRRLRVRLSLENGDGSLRPGMYGSVRVACRGDSSLTVPGESVVHTGERQYVFLMHRDGRCEPQMVSTGATDGDRVEILRGLAAGDTVVASGAFLIDSESRLEAAIAAMGRPRSLP